MPDTTKIVFSGGVEVAVQGTSKDVQRVLGKAKRKGEAFAPCKNHLGAKMYVAADRVAYIEAMAEPPTVHSMLAGRKEPRRRSSTR